MKSSIWCAVLVAAAMTSGVVVAKEVDAPITLQIMSFEDISGGETGRTDAGTRADEERNQNALLQAALPGLFAASLAPYRYIRVIAIPGSEQNLLESKLSDRSAGQPAGTKSSSAQGEFVARGYVRFRNNRIVINVILGNRATGRSQILQAVTMRTDQMYAGAEEVASIIVKEIARQKGIEVIKRSIAVTCLRETYALSDLTPAMKRESISLLRGVITESPEKLARWTLARDYDCSSTLDVGEVARQEHADAVITLSPKSAKKRKLGSHDVLKLTLHIPERRKSIPMPDIIMESSNHAFNDSAAAHLVMDLFKAMLTTTGQWREINIPSVVEKASVYLERGMRIDQHDVNAMTLQDYFFSMAVAQSGELSRARASEARFLLANIRLAHDRPEDAELLLDKAAGLDPENIRVRLARAELAAQQGEYEDAIKRYVAVTKRFPLQPEAYERLATLFTLQNDNERAEGMYRELIKIAPATSIGAYRGLAAISRTKADLKRGENWRQAAGFLEQGIQNLKDEPQKAELNVELASLYADAGRDSYLSKNYNGALEFLGKSISARPSVRGCFYRALTYIRLWEEVELIEKEQVERYRKLALTDYNCVVTRAESSKPIDVSPEYVGSKLGIVEVLILQGQYDDAISAAKDAAGIFRGSREALSLEPVARLMGVAAKVAANLPDYRQDIDQLLSIANAGSRRYDFGPYLWNFGTIDDFVANNNQIPTELKCLYSQVSRTVRVGAALPDPGAGTKCK